MNIEQYAAHLAYLDTHRAKQIAALAEIEEAEKCLRIKSRHCQELSQVTNFVDTFCHAENSTHNI
jgi:endonuclease/exonuclease/phosphatase family metal-dependent hydrolase